MTYLYAFDFDYTLIDSDSSTAWCHYLYEHGIVRKPQFLQREAELMAKYDAGTMRVEDYIAFSMGALRHLPVTEIDAICQDYVQTALKPHVFPQARQLISSLRAEGAHLVVISASAAFIVRAGAALFGFKPEEVIAIEVAQDGKFYSTEIEGQPPYKDGKVTCLQAYQERCGLTAARIHFWTDSANDLPLCRYAQEVSVVNPSPQLLAEAQRHGWEVLHWQR